MQRRIDRSDPRDASAAQPVSVPSSWSKQSISTYSALLSALTCVYRYVANAHRASMGVTVAMVTPFPEMTSFGLLFAVAQVMSIRPYSKMRENEGPSNAFASLLCVPCMRMR